MSIWILIIIVFNTSTGGGNCIREIEFYRQEDCIKASKDVSNLNEPHTFYLIKSVCVEKSK